MSRHYQRVVAFAVLGSAIGAFLMLGSIGAWDWYHTPFPAAEEVEVRSETEAIGMARSLPVSLTIPKLSLEAAFESPLGLEENGEIEVPDSFEQVGWYKHGAAPGEVGPSVILGHVDSKQGPAVFYDLGKLEVGDEIRIRREDGTTAVFSVRSLERYEQKDFPTERVYGSTDKPELRLITCSGTFDRGVRRYTHNLVVYADYVKAD